MILEQDNPARQAAIRHADAIARAEWEGPYIPRPTIVDDRKDPRAPRVVDRTIPGVPTINPEPFRIKSVDEIAGNDMVTRGSMVEMDDRMGPVTRG